MEAQSPPAKIARTAEDSGMRKDGDSTTTTQIGLDLGLGPGTSPGKTSFTFLQLQELEHQALIFKYMAAGIPVPSHLVLPIWKSLGSTYAGTGIYPSFLGCRGVCFDYRNSMEPEPGRCRRTDGKKWRCAKDVVPDQKYCERHMHRGRNRSRKHVEITSPTRPTTPKQAPTTAIAASSSNTNTTTPISVPLQLLTSSTITTTVTATTPTAGLSPKSVLNGSATCKTEENLHCDR